jgi:hypothetical protein
MAKIRINESRLNEIIKESINNVLTESEDIDIIRQKILKGCRGLGDACQALVCLQNNNLISNEEKSSIDRQIREVYESICRIADNNDIRLR